MPLCGYIIEKYNNMAQAYTCNRLVAEARELGMKLQIVGIHDSMLTPSGIYNAGRPLERRDFVINRYKWGKLKDQICGLATRSYNSLEAFNTYINKYEQVRRLRSDAFLLPRYLLGTASVPAEHLFYTLGCPVVAKGLESSMGAQIHLLEHADDLKRLIDAYGLEKEWLFEEYIASSHGRDLRFFSVRGEVVACMQRTAASGFRANVALGATVAPYPIGDELRVIARDIYEQTGLDFLGIDLLFGVDKPYFCEINVMPGIEGIETASGLNIARMVMETIKGDLERE